MENLKHGDTKTRRRDRNKEIEDWFEKGENFRYISELGVG